MISFPWDNTSSSNLDRNVSSDTLAEKYFDMLAGGNCGIYAPVGAQGSVSPGTGMNVVVQPVAGVIKGRIYSEVNVRTLTIQASEAQDRIDTVVIRRDKAGRATDLYIVKGTAATTPVRPALTRSGDIYEVGIADLFIAATTTSITAQRITDTRSETARCQIIPVVGSIDTTTMFNQYQAALDAYLDLVQQAIDETLAGNLQSQIDASEAIIAKHDGNFAGAYSAASTYALNTFVIYANDLYKCTTAITVAEAWTAGHWTKVSVGAELNSLITSLNGLAFVEVSTGKWGYKIGGADPVIPFKTAPEYVGYTHKQGTTNAPTNTFTFPSAGTYYLTIGAIGRVWGTDLYATYPTTITVTNGTYVYDSVNRQYVVTANANCTFAITITANQTGAMVFVMVICFK